MLSFNAYKEHLQPVGYRPNQFQNTKDVFSFSFSDAYRNKALKQGSETRLGRLSHAHHPSKFVLITRFASVVRLCSQHFQLH